MSSQPKVSIIIPVYNNAKEIGECLVSIKRQTFKDYEIIVVDDGSTDGLNSVLKRHQSEIKAVLRQEHQGSPAPMRNFGFKEAIGQYLLFCDSDLVLKPKMLELMVSVLDNNPDIAFVYSSFKYGFKKFKLNDFDLEKLKKINYIHTTSMLRRECFFGFDENLKRFQDWDLWLTLVEKGFKGERIPKVLFKVKRSGRISSWLPKLTYKIPWRKMGVDFERVRKYNEAKGIILKKHNISHFKNHIMR